MDVTQAILDTIKIKQLSIVEEDNIEILVLETTDQKQTETLLDLLLTNKFNLSFEESRVRLPALVITFTGSTPNFKIFVTPSIDTIFEKFKKDSIVYFTTGFEFSPGNLGVSDQKIKVSGLHYQRLS